jgi:hypothetical protein
LQIQKNNDYMIKYLKFIVLVLILTFGKSSYSQITTGELTGQVNTITSAVPFLLIAPDSRGGGFGDAGVATTPDVFSQHYNPAKFAFINGDVGGGISYTPWLRALINDINLSYLAGYYKIGKTQVLSSSLRYFSLGNIVFTDIVGNTTGQFNPNEWAFDFAYSRLLSRKLSGSIALRYIYSNLTGGQSVQGTESHPGHAVAGDVSFYYQDPITFFEKDALLAFGVNFSNLGSKISYTENAQKDFIPANFKFGGALTIDIDDYNSIMFCADINKLLVPTPAIYDTDSITGEEVILYGKDDNISTATAIFQSWYDAPGAVMSDGTRSVFREELNELTYSLGMEYWYSKQFALRLGYFYEAPTKGNREFFTVGLGLKLNVFGLDFSYLVPTQQRNPLENTLRFSLTFDVEALASQSKDSMSKTPEM